MVILVVNTFIDYFVKCKIKNKIKIITFFDYFVKCKTKKMKPHLIL